MILELKIPTFLLSLTTCIFAVNSAHGEDDAAIPKSVHEVITRHCVDCHGADTAEGGVRFDVLPKLKLAERLNLLNKVQEQLFLGQMPPEDEEQPTAEERARLTDWVSQELHKYKAC
jgi:uncharacterized membrane protein